MNVFLCINVLTYSISRCFQEEPAFHYFDGISINLHSLFAVVKASCSVFVMYFWCPFDAMSPNYFPNKLKAMFINQFPKVAKVVGSASPFDMEPLK